MDWGWIVVAWFDHDKEWRSPLLCSVDIMLIIGVINEYLLMCFIWLNKIHIWCLDHWHIHFSFFLPDSGGPISEDLKGISDELMELQKEVNDTQKIIQDSTDKYENIDLDNLNEQIGNVSGTYSVHERCQVWNMIGSSGCGTSARAPKLREFLAPSNSWIYIF